jgi:hypothetical protein
MDNGNLPNLAALARGGIVRDVNAAILAGVAYPTMYTGLRAADHGFHFPLEWNPHLQRVDSWDHWPAPETILERMDKAGKRIVVIDPPECPPLHLHHGFCASGVQFRARVLLNSWDTDAARARALIDRLGPPPRADEVFGIPSLSNLRFLRRQLLQAPQRLTGAALHFLKQDPPDCLWITCCGLHVAGHQFTGLPAIGDPAEQRVLVGTRLDLAQGYDRMIGTLAAALPPGSRVLVAYSKGMDRVTTWLDQLPEMLRRVLGQKPVAAPAIGLRRFIPISIRRWVAAGMSDRLAIATMAGISTPRADWKHTRAFCVPSDFPGFIRCNATGRERDGIVPDRDMAALGEEIAEGLRSFTTLRGEPCVESVDTPSQLLGPGRSIGRFPDLIVRWKQLGSAAAAQTIRSPRFGEIKPLAAAIGRSGNHTPGAFAILYGTRGSGSGPRLEVEDIPSTILQALGLPAADLPGQSFWVA